MENHILDDVFDGERALGGAFLQIDGPCGEGSFGEVFHAYDVHSRKEYAIKIVDLKDHKRAAKGELAILEYLKEEGAMKRNIGKLFTYTEDMQSISFIMEFYEVNLVDYTNNMGLFKLPEARVILSQLLDALLHLRLLRVVHGDLKPNNVMLVDHAKKPLIIKLIDFGCSYHPEFSPWRKNATYFQNKFYRAPEVALGLPWSYPIDMWAFGCVAHDLVLGKLFQANTSFETMHMMVKAIGMPDQEMFQMGKKVKRFFLKEDEKYRLKTVDEFNKDGNKHEELVKRPALFDRLERFAIKLDGDRIENMDRRAYMAMIKELLIYDSADRPAALTYRPKFLTMEHLSRDRASQYFRDSRDKLKKCLTHIEIVGDSTDV